MTTILFYSPQGEPVLWSKALAEAFPEMPVRVYPDVGDPAEVRYALVWYPPRGLMATYPNLRGILNLGAGIDGVLADDLLPPDVPVVRMVNRGLTEGMVEYVVWQVMDWQRHGLHYRQSQRDQEWRYLKEPLARTRTVGIMGLGVLGQACARALRDLHFQVAGWSRSPKDLEGIDCYSGREGLGPFLAKSECLICMLPLTKETRGCLNADLFRQLPEGSHLISVGRGEQLEEADLIPALALGRPASATLDVVPMPEPLPKGHPYWTHPAITITPHIAAQTHVTESVAGIVQAIHDLEAGRRPEGLVSRELGY